MNNMIIFDTCIIIPALKNKSIEIVLDRFADADRFISVITRVELLSYPDLKEEEKRLIEFFLENVTIIPFNRAIEEKTIEFRQRTKRKIPDAIIAATAIILGATLLTRDHHLLNHYVPGLQTVIID